MPLQHQSLGDSAVRLIFPSPDDLLIPAPLRNVTTCALLRLGDGQVRFVRATATMFTTERLDAVEQMLSRLDGDGPSGFELPRRIASELGIPTLTIANTVLDRVDPVDWDLRQTAVAILARALRAHPERWDSASAAEEASALEQRLHADLAQALAAFVTELDQEALAVAKSHGRLSIELYNFLARPPYRAWRLQFARTFPILVRAAMTGPKGSGGAQIRMTVDSGSPLVKPLAARWAVSQSALRCLLGRPVDHVGSQWQDRPHILVRILDALSPEDRPGDDADHWQRLARAVTTAEGIFRRPAASSPLTLGWLRVAARRKFAHLAQTRGGRGLPREDITLIDELRTALVQHLVGVAASHSGDTDADLLVVATTISDRHLASLRPSRLAAIAKRFALEYAPRRAALDEEMRLAEGWQFWPLLPRDFIAFGGTRRVTPLATRADLRREGVAQNLCFGDGAELAQMVRACASGAVFLLSVRDAATGATLSTAEIRVSRKLSIGKPLPRVRQHYANGNTCPSADCVAALQEALDWVGGRDGQAHLEQVWRQAGKRRNATCGSMADHDLVVTTEALRIALGDELHASLQRAVTA